MIFFQTLKLLGMKNNQSGRLYIKHSLQELDVVLQEDYEKAAKIRDEISKES
jgi:protein-arginine kinase activator protein McsA